MNKLVKSILPAILAGYFLLGQVSTVNANPCGVSGGVTTYPAASGWCFTEPDTYKLTLYELYLCTALPTAPTVSTALGTGSCTKVYNDASGTLINVDKNNPSTLNASKVTAPTYGTYTHGVAVVGTTFKITDQMEFASAQVSMGGNTYNIKGDSASSGSGKFCATVAGSSSSGTSMTCGGSAITAGELSEVMKDFGGGGNFSATSMATPVGNNDTMTGYLITTSGVLATASSNVDKIMGIATFGASSTISASTSGMTIQFRKSQAMSLGGNTNGSDLEINVNEGPFAIKILIQ